MGVAWPRGYSPFQAGIPQGRIRQFLADRNVESTVKTSKRGLLPVTPLRMAVKTIS
jgi:hypothetical protein